MKAKRVSKIRMGNLERTVEVPVFGAYGHINYSGFGTHGKIKRAKNRANRRKDNLESRTARLEWN